MNSCCWPTSRRGTDNSATASEQGPADESEGFWTGEAAMDPWMDGKLQALRGRWPSMDGRGGSGGSRRWGSEKGD